MRRDQFTERDVRTAIRHSKNELIAERTRVLRNVSLAVDEATGRLAYARQQESIARSLLDEAVNLSEGAVERARVMLEEQTEGVSAEQIAAWVNMGDLEAYHEFNIPSHDVPMGEFAIAWSEFCRANITKDDIQ